MTLNEQVSQEGDRTECDWRYISGPKFYRAVPMPGSLTTRDVAVTIAMLGIVLLVCWAVLTTCVQLAVLHYQDWQQKQEYERYEHLLHQLNRQQTPEPDPAPERGPGHVPEKGGYTMRVYLAAPFVRQYEMRSYAEQLRAEQIEVVSAWHDLESPSSDGFSGIGADRLAWLAMLDLQQLTSSNAVVVFSHGLTPSFESGVALALGKLLLLIGDPTIKYHYLSDVERFPAWPECFARIHELRGLDAMSTRQAATDAGVTVQEIHEWIKEGRLPAAKGLRGRWVIARNDLDRVKATERRKKADELDAVDPWRWQESAKQS